MNCPECGHALEKHTQEDGWDTGCTHKYCDCNLSPAKIELHHARKALEDYHDLHEGFMVSLCQTLGLVYEEVITEDVVEAVKALKAERQWIPVSERLPEEDGYYLVRTISTHIYKAKNGVYQTWFYPDNLAGHQFSGDVGVTHWQPLPEPPQEQS